MVSTALLELKNVEAVYHRVSVAISGISLSVGQGEIVAMLGPNGAGKSTTLRAISSLLPWMDGSISAGNVRYDDADITGWEPNRIVRSGLIQVPEGRAIFPDLDVMENLMAASANVSRARRDELLTWAFELFPFLRDRPRTKAGYLSGGQQQALVIARALLGEPRLLMIDEPSLGLAPLAQDTIAEALQRINADSGTAILLVEQNAEMALNLAARAYVMESGRIVLADTSENLLSHADIRDFYLGRDEGRYRQVKHYRRRKRWLS